MPTETRRGLGRIIANYSRLFGWLLLGVVLMPFLLHWVGEEGYGLISLIGANLGFAGFFQQLMNQSLIRELGAAYHRGPDEFRRAYSASFAVSGVMAALALLTFLVIFLCVDLLSIPPHLVGPARWFVGAQGVYSVVLVTLSPTFSMYRVLERFGWYAFWMILIRGTALASAVLLAWGIGMTDLAASVKAYGILWSALLCGVALSAVASLMIANPLLRPNLRLMRRDAVREVAHTFGWNSGVQVALNMHDRLAALLMNLAFGLIGNAVFNVARNLVAYVRMLTTGVTFGLDAAAARISSDASPEAMREFIRHSTRLQAFIALPSALGMFLLAEPVLHLWIGRTLDDPDTTIPLAVVIVRILTFGITARAIADGWMFILYGAGHVRRYAPMLIASGVASPIVGVILLLVLPESIRFNGPALAISAVIVVAHFLVLPVIAARCLGMRFSDLITPLIRPGLTTLVCSPLLIVPSLTFESWSILGVIGPCAAFGVVYLILGWFVVLTPEEQTRFGRAMRRRLPGRG